MSEHATPIAGAPKVHVQAGLLGRVIDVFGWAGVVALLVPTFLTCADIVWRRAVGGAFMDIFDLTQLCLVALASWSIPYGYMHGHHVCVDLLVDRFAPQVQALFALVIYLASAALFALLTWFAWDGAMLHYRHADATQNLGLPLVWYWTVFLIGMVLTVLACAAQAGAAWRRLRIGSAPP